MALDLLIQEQKAIPLSQPWWLLVVTTSTNEELTRSQGGKIVWMRRLGWGLGRGLGQGLGLFLGHQMTW